MIHQRHGEHIASTWTAYRVIVLLKKLHFTFDPKHERYSLFVSNDDTGIPIEEYVVSKEAIEKNTGVVGEQLLELMIKLRVHAN